MSTGARGGRRSTGGLLPVLAVLAGALVLAALAVLSTSDGAAPLSEPPTSATPTATRPGTVDGVDVVPFSSSPAPERQQQTGTSEFLRTVVEIVVVVLTVLLVWFLVRLLRRPRPVRDPDRPRPPVVPLPTVAEAVAEDAEAARDALLTGGEPRNAVVACWLRLETSAAGAGLPRTPSETSAEYTERVLGAFAVDRSAIDTLAGLYREARFSSHPMGEPERERAVAALDRLHEQLLPDPPEVRR